MTSTCAEQHETLQRLSHNANRLICGSNAILLFLCESAFPIALPRTAFQDRILIELVSLHPDGS